MKAASRARIGFLFVGLSAALSLSAAAQQRVAPQIFAPGVISGPANDLSPAFTPDGLSNRPASNGGKPLDGFYDGTVQPGGGGNLWRVDRTTRGWGEPHHNGRMDIWRVSLAPWLAR